MKQITHEEELVNALEAATPKSGTLWQASQDVVPGGLLSLCLGPGRKQRRIVATCRPVAQPSGSAAAGIRPIPDQGGRGSACWADQRLQQ